MHSRTYKSCEGVYSEREAPSSQLSFPEATTPSILLCILPEIAYVHISIYMVVISIHKY